MNTKQHPRFHSKKSKYQSNTETMNNLRVKCFVQIKKYLRYCPDLSLWPKVCEANTQPLRHHSWNKYVAWTKVNYFNKGADIPAARSVRCKECLPQMMCWWTFLNIRMCSGHRNLTHNEKTTTYLSHEQGGYISSSITCCSSNLSINLTKFDKK